MASLNDKFDVLRGWEPGGDASIDQSLPPVKVMGVPVTLLPGYIVSMNTSGEVNVATAMRAAGAVGRRPTAGRPAARQPDARGLLRQPAPPCSRPGERTGRMEAGEKCDGTRPTRAESFCSHAAWSQRWAGQRTAISLQPSAVSAQPCVLGRRSALARPGSHQRPHRRPRSGPRLRLNDDAHVLTERVEEAVEPFHGEAREAAPMQVRHVRLGDAEKTRCRRLGQASRGDQVPNATHQFRLGEQLHGVRPPKICKDIIADLVDGLLFVPSPRAPTGLPQCLTHGDPPAARARIDTCRRRGLRPSSTR